ncbi:MAG: ABC transporter permease [Bacteroidales bacterium]|jgi:ABC-2 type transport system permease protein|nr:ABC transporter permease [Bacteroidales bacterium]
MDHSSLDNQPSRKQDKPLMKVIRRECSRMLSRPIYLIVTLIMPLFCYVFFASMMSEGMPKELPVAVVDMDNSNLSRTFTRNLDASPQTRVVAHLTSFHEGKSAMQKGDILGFIVLPSNLQIDAMSGKQPQIVFYTNNSYLITGSLLMRDFSTITALSSAAVNVGIRTQKGEPMQTIMANVQPIALDFHALGNPWTNYSMYLSTILSHGLVQILILLITVFIVGHEIKHGTICDWLAAANGSFFTALIGKLLPYTILFSLVTVFGNTLFFKYLHFTYEGNFFAILVAVILLVIAYQSMALFILSLLFDFRVALTIAGVYGVLGISLSGLTFPIEIMDAPLQGFSYLFPIRHYFHIYVDLAIRGLPVVQTLPYFATLLVFLIFPLALYHRLKRFVLTSECIVKPDNVEDLVHHHTSSIS